MLHSIIIPPILPVAIVDHRQVDVLGGASKSWLSCCPARRGEIKLWLVGLRFDRQQAQQGVRQIIMRCGLSRSFGKALTRQTGFFLERWRKPHHKGYLGLFLGSDHIRQTVQIEMVLT